MIDQFNEHLEKSDGFPRGCPRSMRKSHVLREPLNKPESSATRLLLRLSLLDPGPPKSPQSSRGLVQKFPRKVLWRTLMTATVNLFRPLKKERQQLKLYWKLLYITFFLTLTSLSGIPAFSHTRPYPHCVMHPDGEPFDCIDVPERMRERIEEVIDDPARNSQLGVRSYKITYKMRNNTREIMLVRFFNLHGQDIWPSPSSHYRIEPFSGINNLYLSCSAPSIRTICVGASNLDDSKTWGVGFNNSKYCSDCCFDCLPGERGVVDFNP